jgi:hypothetical protein
MPRTTLRVAIAFATLGLAAGQQHESPDAAGAGNAFPALGLPFVALDGGFVASLGGVVARAEPAAIGLKIAGGPEGDYLRFCFEGAQPSSRWEPEDRQGGRFNILVGDDPACWRTDLAAFARVRATGLFPGIGVTLRAAAGCFEYDLLLEPGADLGSVRVRVEGAEGLDLGDDGALVVHGAAGDVIQRAPSTWQVDADGGREPIAARFRLLDDRTYGFEVPGRDPWRSLFIDPGLEASTFLGGLWEDTGYVTSLQSDGGIALAGYVLSLNFPVTPGAFLQSNQGDADVVVARLTANAGALIYSTYLGGVGSESPTGIHVDDTGVVTLAGTTHSFDFPVADNAFDDFNGGDEGFITRVSVLGDGLLGSTFFAGIQPEASQIHALAVGAEGVTVAGSIIGDSPSVEGFPTTPGAYDVTYNGDCDAFVARLDLALSTLVFCSYLGGSDTDISRAIALAPGGDILVGGVTWSFDFPTTPGVVQPALTSGWFDVFVARFDAAGEQLLVSTLLGGSETDELGALVVGPGEAVTLAGYTYSPDLPVTPGAFDTTFADGAPSTSRDGYVARLDAAATEVLFCSYLGGQWSDAITGLAVDSAGTLTVAGVTASQTFPTTTGAYDTLPGVSFASDSFVVRLARDGSSLHYATLFGGFGAMDDALDLAVGGDGSATIVGRTHSADLPTTPGAFDTTFNSQSASSPDVFVARFDMLPAGVSRYGTTTPSCLGPVAIGVTAMPQGGGVFGLTSTNGPPGSSGLLLVSGLQDAAGSAVKGVELFVAPPLIILPVVADDTGYLELPIPVLGSWVGLTGYIQIVWFGTPECPGLSATPGLAVTVQP